MRFFAPLRMTLARLVILNEVKDLWQNDPLPTGGAVGYLAKGLQLFGMANLMVGLYIGLTDERGMWTELYLLGIGSVLFLLGKLLEGRGRG